MEMEFLECAAYVMPSIECFDDEYCLKYDFVDENEKCSELNFGLILQNWPAYKAKICARIAFGYNFSSVFLAIIDTINLIVSHLLVRF